MLKMVVNIITNAQNNTSVQVNFSNELVRMLEGHVNVHFL